MQSWTSSALDVAGLSGVNTEDAAASQSGARSLAISTEELPRRELVPVVPMIGRFIVHERRSSS